MIIRIKKYFNTFYQTDKKWTWFSLILIFSVFFLSFLTYLGISKKPDLNQTNVSRFGLLYANVGFLLFMVILSFWRWLSIIRRNQETFSANKLKKQIVFIFSMVTVIPGICVAIFASLFFNLGVQAWFGEPVKNALLETDQVIDAYLKEHKKTLGFEAQKMATLLQPKIQKLIHDRESFENILTDLEDQLLFNEALVLDKKQNILAKSYLTFSLELSSIGPEDFKKAKTLGSVTYIYKNQLRALVLIDDYEEIYLYIGKSIDKKILHHVKHHQDAISLYNNLENQRSGFEITFLIIFSLITLILLLTAVWFGLNIANKIVHPVSKLVQAAEEVSAGNLDVYVTPQHFNNELDTLVDSFNTMTSQLKKQQKEIIMTQKKATWSDIARKIAHEIKNPLTPIQLSAERLKKRYLNDITEGKDVFEKCIHTILKQVKHIERLVKEFSNFARMPEAVMEQVNILELLKQSIQFEEEAHTQIQFMKTFSQEKCLFLCDQQHIMQVFMNIIQNSIHILLENNIPQPKIKIDFYEEASFIFITFADNGIGFPKNGREKLTEPYYTTREKGTGLGLSIVEKIVSEHNGTINFSDSNMGGALITIAFKK